MSKTAFPSNPEMTAICQAYQNEMYIADTVFPFSTPVSKTEFKYDEFPIGEQLTTHDDRVSRRGEIQEIDYSSEQKTAGIEDHALSNYLPYADVQSANDPTRVQNNAAMLTMNHILLNREIRVANLLFNADSYVAGNVLTLASDSDKFSDDDVDALAVINTRLDAMLMRANTMTLGLKAWSALRRNPSIVQSTQKNSGKVGMASRSEVAELFELDRLIVGRANRNTNRNPDSLNHGRIWGPHIALTFNESAISPQGTFTFCTTVPYESANGITAGNDFDKKRGVRGSYEVRVAQQLKELIIAKEAGALIINAA